MLRAWLLLAGLANGPDARAQDATAAPAPAASASARVHAAVTAEPAPAEAPGILDATLALGRARPADPADPADPAGPANPANPRLDAAAAHAFIDGLAALWRARVGDDTAPERRARAFAEVLFEDAGFRSVDDLSAADALHLDSVLAERRGYCLSLSVVALALAEELSEPLRAVALPNHVLVRWDDGERHFNLELTRRGAFVDDAALREQLGPFGRTDGLYLRPLTSDEVVALMLHNRGFVALSAGRHEDARADLEAATERLPSLAEGWRNLGVLHGEAGRWSEAIACFGRALAAHPGDVDALLNLALAHAGAGDLDGALDDLDVLALLAPEHPRLQPLRAQWSRRRAARAGVSALDEPPGDLAPGLRVTWFRGTDLRREVGTSVLRDLDLDAGRGAPRRGLPSDGSSARMQGWLRAPDDGFYTVFAVSNDGLRLRVDDEPVIEHWRDVGYTSWQGTGQVHLLAGWHRLQVEWFDHSGNARLFVKIARDGSEYPLDLRECLFHARG